MSKDKYIVIRRRFDVESDSDNHEALFYSDNLMNADKAIKYYDQHEVGDILIVCDMAGVSNMPEEAECVWVVDEFGVPSAPRVHPYLSQLNKLRTTWIEMWEGPSADAYSMVHVACALDLNHKKIILSLCNAARICCDYMLPQRKSEALLMIGDIELWCCGKLRDKDIFHYVNDGWGIPLPRLIRSAMFNSPNLPVTSISEIAIEMAGQGMTNNEATVVLSSGIREIITLRDILQAAAASSSCR